MWVNFLLLETDSNSNPAPAPAPTATATATAAAAASSHHSASAPAVGGNRFRPPPINTSSTGGSSRDPYITPPSPTINLSPTIYPPRGISDTTSPVVKENLKFDFPKFGHVE